MAFADLSYRVEYAWHGPGPERTPTIVMLHHGLGSVAAWRGFPEQVAAATRLGVLVYSRYGYGRSEAGPPNAWPAEFLHREAEGALPELLAHLEVGRPILLGHSDGASIAIMHSGTGGKPAPLGLILLAPHVFVEACTVDSAERARHDFESGDLRDRMARRHDHPDAAFRGWYGAWTRPEFRLWNIEDEAKGITCPVLIVQGRDDEYGTLEQVERIRRALSRSPEVLILDDCGHAPHRDHPEATLAAVARFVERLPEVRGATRRD